MCGVRRWTTRAIAMLALLAAACSNGASSSPTGTTASPSGAAGGTGVTIHPSSSIPPTGPPGLTGVLSQGTASLTLQGDPRGSVELDQLTNLAVYSADPGGPFILAWSDGGKQVLAMGGKTFIGERSTSNALTLTVTVVDGSRLDVFSSSAGECTIDVGTATSSDFSGSFSCSGVPAAAGTASADLQGTFEATE